jgi:putative ABC transport system substrate-binding protein
MEIGQLNRREFIWLLSGAAAWSFAAQAQGQNKKIWRIGQVLAGGRETNEHLAQALIQRLGDLGYHVGENLMLTTRFVTPEPKLLEDTIRSLVDEIDLLVTWSTIAAIAAKTAAHNIPVVFISVGAPVEIGLVETLAHPGSNLTGVTFEAATETYGKRLQILKEIVPGMARVGVLGAQDDANFRFAMVSLEKVAPTLGITIVAMDFRPGDQLADKFDELRKKGAEGLVVVAGARTYANRQAIADLALSSRLPSCHGLIETVAAGGLVGLGPDFYELAGQGAAYIDKIIRGERPADLPVQQPTQYLLFVNLRTARALDLTVPEALLARANQVFE